MKTVTRESKIDGFAFTALHAEAEGRRRGGIVLCQEIFGLDRFMRADVACWAGLGFEVYAPSLFAPSRASRPSTMRTACNRACATPRESASTHPPTT